MNNAHPDRKKVLKYLNDHQCLKDYATFLGIEYYHLTDFLKKPTPLKNKDLAAFYSFSGCTPRELGIERDLHFFTNSSPSLDQYEFLSFNEWEFQRNRAEDYIEKYFEAILEKVKLAGKSIFVFDYLINQYDLFSGDERQRFFRGYKNYFDTVSKIVRERNLEYFRILGMSNSKFETILATEEEKIKCIKAVIESMFERTFEHICRLFTFEKFKFYILPVGPRNYSIMLVDDTYVLTEYLRIRKDGKAVPDLLFINKAYGKVDNNAKRLIDVYNREFSEMIEKEDRSIEVNSDLFFSCTKELKFDLDKEMKELDVSLMNRQTERELRKQSLNKRIEKLNNCIKIIDGL